MTGVATLPAEAERAAHFTEVTEFAGQAISVEQLERMTHRYHWAATFCADKDVTELACGGGQGLGLLARVAKSVSGSDISPDVLQNAQAAYDDDISLAVFPADATPFGDASLDTVLIFEAIYYLADFSRFAAEITRILRPGGTLLIVTANKDLFDFSPSPWSNEYLGVAELTTRLASAGFETQFWGYVDVRKISLRQRLFRPVKYLVSKANLMPKTLSGRSWLKKIVFGAMTNMPARIDNVPFDYTPPSPLPAGEPSRDYKVIYCAARKPGV